MVVGVFDARLDRGQPFVALRSAFQSHVHLLVATSGPFVKMQIRFAFAVHACAREDVELFPRAVGTGRLAAARFVALRVAKFVGSTVDFVPIFLQNAAGNAI